MKRRIAKKLRLLNEPVSDCGHLRRTTISLLSYVLLEAGVPIN